MPSSLKSIIVYYPTVRMHKLVCAFAVRKPPEKVFSRRGTNDFIHTTSGLKHSLQRVHILIVEVHVYGIWIHVFFLANKDRVSDVLS